MALRLVGQCRRSTTEPYSCCLGERRGRFGLGPWRWPRCGRPGLKGRRRPAFRPMGIRSASGFHHRIVPSVLTLIRRSFELKVTPSTPSVWPINVVLTPEPGVHRRTVLSALALARRLPSGLNARPVTSAVWPDSGSGSSSPLLAFQNHTLPSRLPEATVEPSAVNASVSAGPPPLSKGRSFHAVPTGSPVSASHNRTLPERSPVAS